MHLFYYAMLFLVTSKEKIVIDGGKKPLASLPAIYFWAARVATVNEVTGLQSKPDHLQVCFIGLPPEL
jgi:hypothetical protein